MRPRVFILSDLWKRARKEHSTPREIGWSVAVGVLAGCTPFLGLHMWIALGLATLLRLNRIAAFVGSRISFTPLFALVTFCEIETAHCLRTGAWVHLSVHDAVEHGKELLGDWVLGTVIVGSVLATSLGVAAYLLARRWHAKGSSSAHQAPPAPPPRSSESPPSAPPAPTR